MTTTYTKPFDHDAALAGAPYACANGQPAWILNWNAGDSRYTLAGTCCDAEVPSSWTRWGRHCSGVHLAGEYSDFDLVMTPLGYLDGKPVFDGDVLVDTRGEHRRANAGMVLPGSWAWPTPRPAPARAPAPAEAERLERDLDVAEAVVLELRRLLDNQPKAVWQLLNRQHLATIIARVPS